MTSWIRLSFTFLKPGCAFSQLAYVRGTKTSLTHPGRVVDAALRNERTHEQLEVGFEEHLLVGTVEDLWVLADDLRSHLIEGWLRVWGGRGHDVCLFVLLG